MKSLGMLKLPMILAGLGAALAFSPACKAQEANPDHFTDSGVQDVYEASSAKAAAPKPKQNHSASPSRTSQTNLSAALQPVAERTPVSATQISPKTVADKRKTVPANPKKQ